MDERDFIKKVTEIQEKFERDASLLLDQYREEVKKITKAVEERRISELRKELGS